MHKPSLKAAWAAGLLSLYLACSGQAFAETRIDTVFLDTESQRLLIDGAEFTKDLPSPNAKVFVALGGKRLTVESASDTFIEASYADAYPNGLADGAYQVFVSRVDTVNGVPIGAHDGSLERKATFSLTVGASFSLNFRGPWVSGTAYAKNDVVSLRGSSYVALASSKSRRPDVFPLQWTLLAQAGEPGPSGFTQLCAALGNFFPGCPGFEFPPCPVACGPL